MGTKVKVNQYGEVELKREAVRLGIDPDDNLLTWVEKDECYIEFRDKSDCLLSATVLPIEKSMITALDMGIKDVFVIQAFNSVNKRIWQCYPEAAVTKTLVNNSKTASISDKKGKRKKTRPTVIRPEAWTKATQLRDKAPVQIADSIGQNKYIVTVYEVNEARILVSAENEKEALSKGMMWDGDLIDDDFSMGSMDPKVEQVESHLTADDILAQTLNKSDKDNA